MHNAKLMQYIHQILSRTHNSNTYFEENRVENINFSYYLAGHSCGIRKIDVRNIFPSLSNRTNAIYDRLLRKCAQTCMYAQLERNIMEERDDIVYAK